MEFFKADGLVYARLYLKDENHILII